MTTNSPGPTTRWGIIGAAGIARSVVPDMIATEGVEVVAVYSRTRASAEALAADFGIPRVVDDLETLLADGDIDAVYVATPHTLHLEQSRAALDAGKHVVCEKPLTTSLEDSRALVEHARARGLLLLEAMWMWFSPGFAAVREAIDRREIGDPRLVTATFGFPTGDRSGRLWDPALGGGSLLDMGIYPLAFALGVFGTAPSRLAAFGSVHAGTVDAETSMLLGWEDGRQALVASSLVAKLPAIAVVSGTEGRIEVAEPLFRTRRMMVVPREGEPRVQEIEVIGNGYGPQFAAAHRAIVEGRVECPEMPHEISLELARLMDEALRQVRGR